MTDQHFDPKPEREEYDAFLDSLSLRLSTVVTEFSRTDSAPDTLELTCSNDPLQEIEWLVAALSSHPEELQIDLDILGDLLDTAARGDDLLSLELDGQHAENEHLSFEHVITEHSTSLTIKGLIPDLPHLALRIERTNKAMRLLVMLGSVTTLCSHGWDSSTCGPTTESGSMVADDSLSFELPQSEAEIRVAVGGNESGPRPSAFQRAVELVEKLSTERWELVDLLAHAAGTTPAPLAFHAVVDRSDSCAQSGFISRANHELDTFTIRVERIPFTSESPLAGPLYSTCPVTEPYCRTLSADAASAAAEEIRRYFAGTNWPLGSCVQLPNNDPRNLAEVAEELCERYRSRDEPYMVSSYRSVNLILGPLSTVDSVHRELHELLRHDRDIPRPRAEFVPADLVIHSESMASFVKAMTILGLILDHDQADYISDVLLLQTSRHLDSRRIGPSFAEFRAIYPAMCEADLENQQAAELYTVTLAGVGPGDVAISAAFRTTSHVSDGDEAFECRISFDHPFNPDAVWELVDALTMELGNMVFENDLRAHRTSDEIFYNASEHMDLALRAYLVEEGYEDTLEERLGALAGTLHAFTRPEGLMVAGVRMKPIVPEPAGRFKRS